jgi:hypothetical protein
MTDGSGQYRLLVAAGGNYTVTPSLAGYIFRPPDLSFDDLTGSQRASFEALQDQTITFGRPGNETLGSPAVYGQCDRILGSPGELRFV